MPRSALTAQDGDSCTFFYEAREPPVRRSVHPCSGKLPGVTKCNRGDSVAEERVNGAVCNNRDAQVRVHTSFRGGGRSGSFFSPGSGPANWIP